MAGHFQTMVGEVHFLLAGLDSSVGDVKRAVGYAKFEVMSLPPLNPDPPPAPRLAPSWVALLAAWLGLVTLIASIVFPFLPGSRHPKAELQHQQPYSFADKFIPFPIYASVVAMFLGIVVLWQMRREPRPLPDALLSQRMQAWAGIVLALLGAAIIYIAVALRGPRSIP